MVALNELRHGPIVGWTRPKTVRLWGRGKHDKKTDDEGVPTGFVWGVCRMREKGGNFGSPKVFPMKPVFDCTGIVEFDGLKADQRYEFEMGWLSGDDDNSLGADVLAGLDWTNASQGSVKTPEDDDVADISFVFGSCRYLVFLAGAPRFRKRGDRAFREIRNQINEGTRTDLIFMVGDQIYADDLDFIAPDRTLKDYRKRYRAVFRRPHMRALMANLPTYMILDDHEIINNYSLDWKNHQNPRKAKKRHDQVVVALETYRSYQVIHGPAFDLDKTEGFENTPYDFWYSFELRGASFFAMDTRTERTRRTNPPRVVSPTQLQALKSWLSDSSRTTKAKFVVGSIPFFPDKVGENEDKWQAFVEQRDDIISHIHEENIKKVVFLAGDVHASMSGQLECVEDQSFKITSVVSSPFFHALKDDDPSDFVTTGVVSRAGGNTYRIASPISVNTENNFTRLTLKDNDLKVEVFQRKGGLLASQTIAL